MGSKKGFRITGIVHLKLTGQPARIYFQLAGFRIVVSKQKYIIRTLVSLAAQPRLLFLYHTPVACALTINRRAMAHTNTAIFWKWEGLSSWL